jgi:hypothetical protein
MSHNRNSDRIPSAGYSWSIDPNSARRQFNMSIGLLAVMAVAICAVAFTSDLTPAPVSSRTARLTVQAPQLVHIQQAENPASMPSGS